MRGRGHPPSAFTRPGRCDELGRRGRSRRTFCCSAIRDEERAENSCRRRQADPDRRPHRRPPIGRAQCGRLSTVSRENSKNGRCRQSRATFSEGRHRPRPTCTGRPCRGTSAECIPAGLCGAHAASPKIRERVCSRYNKLALRPAPSQAPPKLVLRRTIVRLVVVGRVQPAVVRRWAAVRLPVDFTAASPLSGTIRRCML
jgi:hypothetical protein